MVFRLVGENVRFLQLHKGDVGYVSLLSCFSAVPWGCQCQMSKKRCFFELWYSVVRKMFGSQCFDLGVSRCVCFFLLLCSFASLCMLLVVIPRPLLVYLIPQTGLIKCLVSAREVWRHLTCTCTSNRRQTLTFFLCYSDKRWMWVVARQAQL